MKAKRRVKMPSAQTDRSTVIIADADALRPRAVNNSTHDTHAAVTLSLSATHIAIYLQCVVGNMRCRAIPITAYR